MNAEKRLLIAGGGYADIPLIKAGQKLGYHVITSGNRPDDLGHRVSDAYRPGDFSDPEAMLRIARDEQIDAICACCNDFSAISSAYVAERLDLPGHDSYELAKLIHHKDKYRAFTRANGIPAPVARGFDDIAGALAAIPDYRLPLIVKPVDLTGGKGVSRIDSLDQAKQALEHAFATSKSKRVVVEEYIQGSRHGFSAFLWDSKVVFHFADNEHYYLNQYLVSAASAPTFAPTAAVDRLVAQTENIASRLSMKNGIFHVQYILRNGEPIIIEICRRPPGDLYIEFVKHATGVDYPSWLVRAAAGLDCSGLSQREPDGYITRQCVMTNRTGILKDVVFDPEIADNVIDRLMWWNSGERVEQIMTAKFGIVFLRFSSMDEMLYKTERMQDLIRAVIVPA